MNLEDEALKAYVLKREAEIRQEERRKCAQIAAAEYQYWRELQLPELPDVLSHTPEENLANMHIAAMGASANICCAVWLGKTPEEHTLDLGTRSPNSTNPFPHRDVLDQVGDLLDVERGRVRSGLNADQKKRRRS